MRGRPIRVLLLLVFVPLVIVLGLLAVAALDGRGAERAGAAAERARAVPTGAAAEPTRAAAERARAEPTGAEPRPTGAEPRPTRAEPERTRAATRAFAPTGTVRTGVGRGVKGAAIFRQAGADPGVAGPVVVFLHGWSRTDARIYGPWITHIVRGGSTVIFPAYQASPYVDTGSPLPNTQSAVAAALETVRLARGRLVVAGYSAGGALAADLAASARSAGLPAPAAVLSIYPGRSLPGFSLRIPAVSARGIAPGTRLVVLAGERDRLVGTRVARQIARTATRTRATLRIVRHDAVDDHGAPERHDAAARRTFWAPLDRLIAATR